MARGNTVVYGIFKDRNALERCVENLKAHDIQSADISVLMQDKESTREFAHEKQTKAPEGTTVGAGTGAVVGGTLGWLAGIGSLAIPGVGPLIAAGPIMAALAGTGIGGTIGGISGALIGMGIPEYEAKRYEGVVHNGGMLLSVHCNNSDEVSRVKDFLRNSGAEDVSSTGEAKADVDADVAKRAG